MSEKVTKTADQLTVGAHVWMHDGVRQVASVVPYRTGDGREFYAVTLRSLAFGEPVIEKHAKGWAYELATDVQIGEWQAMGVRRALADALHALADEIVDNQLPLPAGYGYADLRMVLDSRADVERWAKHMDVEVNPSGNIPSVDQERLVTGRLFLSVHVQGPKEPEHQEVSAWGDLPGQCGVKCACGTTFDGFDTTAMAARELNAHIMQVGA